MHLYIVDPHVCEAHMVGPMYIRSHPSALVDSPFVLTTHWIPWIQAVTSLLVDHVTVQCLPFR